MSRYSRHIVLSEIGQVGQNKLAKAKVLVVGAGGLGCPVLQYLAAAGVGTIGIIDFDTVDISNLQRQVLYGTTSLGVNKAMAAKQRLQDLNDEITINAYPQKLTYKNALNLFSTYDIIIDGTDNFETRYLVNDACVILNKPLVFGGIYKFEGQVSVFNYKNGPSYRCLFPKAPKKGAYPNCSEIGVLGVLPGIIGSIQANEVLKIILNIGNVLSGILLCYNALTSKTVTLKINRNEANIESVLNNVADFENESSKSNFGVEPVEISIKDLIDDENIQYIDVRELNEKPRVKRLEVTNIPLSDIKNNLDKIEDSKIKALFCQSGIRSKIAFKLLLDYNITNCFSITEGAVEINNYIQKTSLNER
ncbi:HesA/MoeB/ThiF family protein [Winogradskyella alexanderae]|uniref:HesA/MoeB/ThiF family protein n=1 Tax=Winogradskyella alexanderae TaxID=2877123 RepID=A0ABS7XUL2_9FLAO|nr:HesA/MoeB/ThiF family protein [Winogradskyella alexanderae]MCA0133169.1 HesA/MoeB/ThiF family protein [Winogradskyella alexanderae]